METLQAYWSSKELITNGLVLMHMLGAMATGLMIGYERSYHGRAAGLRTYSLVCMASTALTVVNGYPHMWYAGLSDTRDCTGCSCEPPNNVTCGGTTHLFADFFCLSEIGSVEHDGACTTVQNGPTEGFMFETGEVSGGSCTATGGQSVGGVQAASPTTACCTP